MNLGKEGNNSYGATKTERDLLWELTMRRAKIKRHKTREMYHRLERELQERKVRKLERALNEIGK